MAGSTPEHLKKKLVELVKLVELLSKWTKEIPKEPKIAEGVLQLVG